MTDRLENEASVAKQATQLSQLMNNPGMLLIMLVLVGGQGADLFASNGYTAEIRELRIDVQRALDQIVDNSARLASVEQDIDELEEQLRETRRDVQTLQVEIMSRP